MAFQLFAKGKERVPVTGSKIVDVSQFSIHQGTLSGVSLTGFTAYGNGINVPTITLTIPNLTVGVEYNYTFDFSDDIAGLQYAVFTLNTMPLTGGGGGSLFLYELSPHTFTGSFIAVETSAKMVFNTSAGVQAVTESIVVSSLSVTGADVGFNGVNELDVISGSPFTLDLNFKDIKDLKAKGSHSYNFRLPSSPDNDAFFGSYFQVGSYYSNDNFSFNPFGMAECFVLQDTLEVFKGNLQLTNIYLKDKNRYEYECIIFSSEVGFIDILKGVKFLDLDYSEWNHELTPTIVYNSYNADGIDGGNIRYSLWDYGIGHASNQYVDYFQQPAGGILLWTTNSFDITKLRPQVKLKALIDKVFNMAGYKYESAFFDSADFGKIYQDLNYNKTESIYTEVPSESYLAIAENTSTQLIPNSQSNIALRKVEFPTEITDEAVQWNNTDSYWSCQVDGSYTITITGKVTPSLAAAVESNNVAFQFWNGWNGVLDEVIETDDIYWVGGLLSVPNVGAEFSISVVLPYVLASNVATKRYRVSLWCGVIDNDYNGASLINWELEDMKINIVANDIDSSTTNLVYINNLFGELKIDHWWKSILTKFNLVTIPSKTDSKILKIEPYNDYVDTGVSKDWNDKIDYKKDVQITPPTKYCGKQVKFKDSQSNDYMYQSYKRNPFNEEEPTYGEYIEPGVRNQFAEKDTVFTSVFVPTINYPLNNGAFNLGVYSCAVWNVKEDGTKQNTGGIRLSFFHGVKELLNGMAYRLDGNAKTNYPFFSAYSEKDFTDGTNVWSINWKETLTTPPQDWDSLPGFGLARKFWKNYILDNFNVNSRMITASIRLNPRDIADFSFADTIQLMGQNYRVNSIKGYPISSTGNAKVELLLVNKSTFLPTPPLTSDGGIIVGENVVDCDFIFAYQWEGAYLMFTTSTNSTPSSTAITQECCQAMGFEWQEYAPTGAYKCYEMSFPNLPDNSSGSRNGNSTDNGSNIIVGRDNTASGGVNNISGIGNTISGNSFNNKIEGNYNEIGRGVNASFVYGNYNKIISNQIQRELFGERLTYNTTIDGGRISGNYGKLSITGDDVIANGDSVYPVGTKQKGNFIVNFYHDSNADRDVVVGQYGILISNYTNPVILYSNVDSSVIDTEFGTTTIECYSLSKPPYYDVNDGGFVAFKIASSGRALINWTLSVKYETTNLKDLISPSIQNPTALTDCVLWLDASNQKSVKITSGTSVDSWQDISGGSNHILQSSATYKPTYKLDFWQRPHLDFDGSTANLNNSDADLLALSESDNTFIAVYKSDITTAEYYGQVIMGCIQPTYTPRVGLRVNANGGTGAGSSDSIAYSSQSASSSVNACNIPSAGVTDLSIAIGRRTGTAVKVFDGNGNTDTGTTGADNTSVTATTSGTTDLYEFNGKIYELICYDRALTDLEVESTITYLKNKWSII